MINRGTAWARLCGFAFLVIASLEGRGASRGKLIQVHAAVARGATTFTIENLQTAHVTVTFALTTRHFAAPPSREQTFTLEPLARTNLCRIQSQPGEGEPTWSYTYHATWGDLEARHDDDYQYSRPFAPNRAFPVSQGFNSQFSHTGGDAYAIDFKMPVGTPVHAARGGVVAAVKVDSESGGPEARFEWDANFILIRHADGTFGHYVHLQKDGARVQVGQAVETGDWIGLSGDTGRSTGPHLHFAVFRARDGRSRETFPIRFRAPRLIAPEAITVAARD